jgi:hypothetical protein
MPLSANETELVGSWVMKDRRMNDDEVGRRIECLVQTELAFVSDSHDGWSRLYQDSQDGRFWELYRPQSHMHGGGPESLRVLSHDEAISRFGLETGGLAPFTPSTD